MQYGFLLLYLNLGDIKTCSEEGINQFPAPYSGCYVTPVKSKLESVANLHFFI